MLGWIALTVVYAALAGGAGFAVRQLRKESKR
jgi:hypothetical protein